MDVVFIKRTLFEDFFIWLQILGGALAFARVNILMIVVVSVHVCVLTLTIGFICV